MRLLMGLCTMAAAGLASAPAALAVPLEGQFVAEERCEAFQSIRKRTNPGEVVISAGETYTVRQLNKVGGEWVQVVIPGAPETRDRWVNIGCGSLTAQLPDPDSPGPERPDAVPTTFGPFFDETDTGPKDMTPRPPQLDAFDEAVLEVCGPWGSHPRPTAFRAMLDRPALATDVGAIYDALCRSVDGGARVGLYDFKDRLRDIWFDEKGFAHIFCGEPSSGNIGGLHFHGRYLELQKLSLAGPMSEQECGKAEIEPPVYTMGVWFRTPQGGVNDACPKGYGLDLNARDLLMQATAAFATVADETGKKMCLKEVVTPGDPDYLAVFVIKNGAVRTFYPDASPRCDVASAPVQSCTCGT